MKKPILFNTEMVKAILDGRKSVTRRKIDLDIINKCDIDVDDFINPINLCKYKVGDILWVKEPWWIDSVDHKHLNMLIDFKAVKEGYRHAEVSCNFTPERFKKFVKFYQKKGMQPSLFMPKEAARIFLKVVDVRVERLKDMTLSDYFKEGFSACEKGMVQEFKRVWDSTIEEQYPKYCWDTNPYVWAVAFERME